MLKINHLTGFNVGGASDKFKELVGSESIFFNADSSYEISLAMLSETKAIAAFRTGLSYNPGYACVLTIEGGEITAVGTAVEFNHYNPDWISIAALSETQAIVTYRDDGDDNQGRAIVLTVSGTTITVGIQKSFNSGTQSDSYVVALSPTKAVVSYRNDPIGSRLYARVINVSGSTITFGTALEVSSTNSCSFISSVKLTDTKIITTCRWGSTSEGAAVILNVSGSTITPGAMTVFATPGNISLTSVDKLSETKAIVIYTDEANSYYGTACILDVSGSTITPGTEVVFFAGHMGESSVSAISETKAVASYRDNVDSGKGKSCVLDISGSTITVGNKFTFNDASSNYTDSVTIPLTKKILVGFTDGGRSGSPAVACILY